METKKIDRTADVLSSLKSACELPNKKDIVVAVLECVMTGFNTLGSSSDTPREHESNMISREQFVQVMNMYISEIKKNNNK